MQTVVQTPSRGICSGPCSSNVDPELGPQGSSAIRCSSASCNQKTTMVAVEYAALVGAAGVEQSEPVFEWLTSIASAIQEPVAEGCGSVSLWFSRRGTE